MVENDRDRAAPALGPHRQCTHQAHTTLTALTLLSLASSKTNYLALSKDVLFMALQTYMTIQKNVLMISISKHKINGKEINVLFYGFYVKTLII